MPSASEESVGAVYAEESLSIIKFSDGGLFALIFMRAVCGKTFVQAHARWRNFEVRHGAEPSGCDDGRPRGYMARIYERNLHDRWGKTITCSLKSVRGRTLISTNIYASLAESSIERLRPLVM